MYWCLRSSQGASIVLGRSWRVPGRVGLVAFRILPWGFLLRVSALGRKGSRLGGICWELPGTVKLLYFNRHFQDSKLRLYSLSQHVTSRAPFLEAVQIQVRILTPFFRLMGISNAWDLLKMLDP